MAIHIRTPVDIDDFPRCAVCNRPVEDFYTLEDDSGLLLVVECHRAVETIRLRVEDLALIDTESAAVSLAFANGRTQEEQL